MAFSKIEKLDSGNIEKTILSTSQQLVELRLKKVTRQAFKPHEFKHAKRLLAQLLTLQNSQNKAN
jgi:large subunit ribosomal protein L29